MGIYIKESMWGKKKKDKKNEPTNKGYIGDMSEDQAKCLVEFKKWIVDKEITHNPWHNDIHFLKFCRARNFDLEKVKQMFTEYMEYRKTHGIDTIIQDFHFDKEAELSTHYPRGYCGVDKIGRPVYIEVAGRLNPGEIWKIVDQEVFVKTFH